MDAVTKNKELNTPIEYLKGIGPQKGELLRKELNIHTFEDLLMHFPFRYVDRSRYFRIREIKSTDVQIQFKGKIETLSEEGGGKAKRLVAVASDGTDNTLITWFKGFKWVREFIKPGEEYVFFGKPSFFKRKLNFVHPEIESLNSEKQKVRGGLQPVYSSTEKLRSKNLDSRGIERLQKNLALELGEQIKEILPGEIIEEFKLMPRQKAVMKAHFPQDHEESEQALRRLKFEELFFSQLRMVREKSENDYKQAGHVFKELGQYFHRFYEENLPFELTGAQKRVIKEVRYDLASGHQMNRLLQGDVGSGKTVVALMCMLIAIDNGKQACLMAPTEILAQQHYRTILDLTNGLGLRVAILTGSTQTSRRQSLLRALKNGNLHILVGTHALIEEKVEFHDLGFVTVDEQHRFGVAQRGKLWAKNTIPPHILVMTATPIPRTLAMTLYGDLDTSEIDELPPGRKPIITRHYREAQRMKVNGFLRRAIAAGQQVYVVYPLIEESETLDYKNLMEGYDAMSRDFPPPDYNIGVVHGKMKPEDKETQMQTFKNGKTHILVATTVIEVGVDVPNATVMVIENAERFGLSQLHQLRGRIGRGDQQSVCILMTGDKLSEDARYRMKTMVSTNNGFTIAQADLKLRGPGDISGTRQSGVVSFKIANLATDQKILQAARKSAKTIIEKDPLLADKKHKGLRDYLDKSYGKSMDWSLIA